MVGVDPNCVRGWVEKLGGEVQAMPGGEGAMASELRRLHKENSRLLMERDILKKAAAYFAREQYATREQAKQSIFEYIEVFYNRKKLHSSLGYKSPEAFETGLN